MKHFQLARNTFVSPETVATRLLEKLTPGPPRDSATFRNQGAIDPGVYLQFALVLHRTESIFIAPPTNRAT